MILIVPESKKGGRVRSQRAMRPRRWPELQVLSVAETLGRRRKYTTLKRNSEARGLGALVVASETAALLEHRAARTKGGFVFGLDFGGTGEGLSVARAQRVAPRPEQRARGRLDSTHSGISGPSGQTARRSGW